MGDELQTELDKIGIDQLHKVVLQLSSNCFETKKLCATILVTGLVLVTSFTHHQLDFSIFTVGAFITVLFWFVDSYSYYYQEKLRVRMKQLESAIVQRAAPKLVNRGGSQIDVEGIGMPISANREKLSNRRRILRSIFNASMGFYMALLVLQVILAILFQYGVIRTLPSPTPNQ